MTAAVDAPSGVGPAVPGRPAARRPQLAARSRRTQVNLDHIGHNSLFCNCGVRMVPLQPHVMWPQPPQRCVLVSLGALMNSRSKSALPLPFSAVGAVSWLSTFCIGITLVTGLVVAAPASAEGTNPDSTATKQPVAPRGAAPLSSSDTAPASPPVKLSVSTSDPAVAPVAPSTPAHPAEAITAPAEPPKLSGADVAAVPAETSDPTGTAGTADPAEPAAGRLAQEQGAHGAHLGQGLEQAPRPMARMAKPFAQTFAAWQPPGVKGLDVSGWQPKRMDWASQWNLGARFAYVKATEGDAFKSDTFGYQYNDAYQAGLIRGAYHFALPIITRGSSNAVSQAKFFVKNGGGWSGDGKTLPPLLDIEWNPYPSIAGGNMCFGLSPSQMVKWIGDFSDTVKSLTGRAPMIYTAKAWWTPCTNNSTAFTDQPLHVAAYTGGAPLQMLGGWDTYSVWQYSSTGPFTGDSNVWNGSLAQLQTFARGKAPTPAPAPKPQLDTTRKLIAPGDFNGDRRPDLLVRKPDGTLWFLPGNGAGKFGTAIRIGHGWNIFDTILGVGDYNSDGKPDLLARKPSGALSFYAGTGQVSSTSSGYLRARTISSRGWEQYKRLIPTGDLNSDNRPDTLAIKPDGSLWFYPGDGNGSYSPRVRVGSGFRIYNDVSGVGDYNGDGRADLFAVAQDGSSWLYPGKGTTGNGTSGFATRVNISGSGWNRYAQVVGGGDYDADGHADMVAAKPDGSYYFYSGAPITDPGYTARWPTGTTVWKGYTHVIAPGDFNGDKKSDLIATKPDGTMWLIAGRGSGAYDKPRRIGHGWQVFDKIVSVGDYTGDRIDDLVARRVTGTLYLYPGTGRVDSGHNGLGPRRQIGSYGWNQYNRLIGAGDLDSDHKDDLLATKPDGTVYLYRGLGNGNHRPRIKVARNRQIFDRILGVGDYDRDGRNDLVNRKRDGSLWLTAGTGTGRFAHSERIGRSGWDKFSHILGGSDYDGDGRADMLVTLNTGSLWTYSGTGRQQVKGYRPAVSAGTV